MNQSSGKLESVREFIRKKMKAGILIAFSGGVDSSTLAAITHQMAREKTAVVTAVSPIVSHQEKHEIKQIAQEIGVNHYFQNVELLNQESFAQNPVDRCYYCKKELMNSFQKLAKGLGFQVIFEGTTRSDLTGHRPGFEVVKEMDNVFSPWVKFGFTKGEIRSLAKSMGLSVYSRPSQSCLASRVPFGEPITQNRLRRIEKAEKFIKEILKVKQLRVRDHNGIARIEVGKRERSKFFDEDRLEEVGKALKSFGFKYVILDVLGYQEGSMLRTVNSKGNG